MLRMAGIYVDFADAHDEIEYSIRVRRWLKAVGDWEFVENDT